MKKGFTLVELISVIIILAILFILALPNITNLLNQEKSSISSAMEEVIKTSGERYIQDNYEIYARTNGNVYCIQLKQLIDEEYLSSPLIDPVTTNEIDTNQYFKAEVVNDKFEYSINSSCTPVEK